MTSTAAELAPVQIRCQTCGAEITVAADVFTARCPYCDSPAVVDRLESRDRPDPVFAIPFVIDHERAAERVRAWIRRHKFTPTGLAAAAFERVRGTYVPAYLYNAVAHSDWTAQIGEDYTETETYTVRDSKGNTHVRTRTVTKTEYRPLSGVFATYLVDVVVSASRGVTNTELESIEPFDWRALVPYEPGLVSGWIAEEPQLARDTCLVEAHGEAQRLVARRLQSFMPGDSHRGIEHETVVSDEEVALVLVPVWVFALRRGPNSAPVRIVLNGQTNAIHGRVPRSALKIVAAILIGLLVVLAIALIAQGSGARLR